MLIAVEDRNLLLVIVRTAIVMEVITRRVITRTESLGAPLIPNRRRYTVLQVRQVLLIDGPILFLCGAQTVETDILQRTRTGFITEGHYRTGRSRNKTPDR